MKLVTFAAPALAIALFAGTGAAFAQGYGPPPPPPDYRQGPGYGQGPGPGYGQGPGGWDAPPQEFRDFQRRGFHDGVEGARRDFENHRRPSPQNRDEFRHPAVPREMRADYRDGFRKGYFAAMSHMQGGPGPGYGPPR